eukprot:scaffold76427_cov57-Phaeocystis_antarctica.AAC.2
MRRVRVRVRVGVRVRVRACALAIAARLYGSCPRHTHATAAPSHRSSRRLRGGASSGESIMPHAPSRASAAGSCMSSLGGPKGGVRAPGQGYGYGYGWG